MQQKDQVLIISNRDQNVSKLTQEISSSIPDGTFKNAADNEKNEMHCHDELQHVQRHGHNKSTDPTLTSPAALLDSNSPDHPNSTDIF